MAIYHLSMQIISRSKGQSAVASAAYRSGERLEDERTGETKYYVREVQPETMILAPSNSPEWVKDRGQLWNAVEQIEKRKDSQLAREINVALPREFSNEKQKELIQNFVQNEFVNKGMIADIAIHRDDKENPHAHIMLSMRTIDEDGFGKKNRDWNADFANSKENNRGFVKSGENCLDIRAQWAEYANKALEKAGIQDRISHESHAKRNLILFPTVHLGHVAAEMEKRGVESDRGTINRERQEYNRLVVDLEKYREEKQALKQEKARQQKHEQKQKSEQINTPAELVDLLNASKVLKAEPSLQNLVNRYKELDKSDERLNKNDSYIRWKDEAIRGASEHFRWIHSFEKQIQEAEKQIENINWLNPLKLKENRITKDRAEQDISRVKGEIKFQDEKLNYHREKLDFNNEKEFNQVKNQHETERPGLLEKNRNTRKDIHSERDVLKKAQIAHNNAFVRQVASLYPERPEMRYISFQTALDIVGTFSMYGTGKLETVPIETIEKTVNSRKQEIQRLQGEFSRVDQMRGRLQRAEHYLKNFEGHQAIVEKYENNPFLKGKMLVSKSAKREYDSAVTARDSYENYMQKEGISGRADFEKQKDTLGKMEAKFPEFKGQIQSQEKGLGLLEAVIKGIEQASREMNRQQNRQQQQRGNGKRRQQTRDDR